MDRSHYLPPPRPYRNVEEELPCTELNASCFVVVLGLWFFASTIMIRCVYESQNVWIGPNSSILLEPSSLFVKSVKVKELDYTKQGLQLYGFNGSPPHNCLVNWSESRVLPVLQDSYKGWPYYLNEGSSMNISYNVTPKGSVVQLVINEGMQGISHSSLNKIAFRDTAWSWNLIQGSGVIELKISKSSNYYLTVANLKRKDVEVELNIDVRAVMYDTRQSFYSCTFTNGECTFKEMSLVGSSVVITSPALSQGVSIEDEWYINISYEHRKITYVIGTGVVICFMLVAMHFSNFLQWCCGERPLSENVTARARLLENKDEDGSCKDSFANDDADMEECVGDDGEARDKSRSLCAICYDAPRDCFFLPCGHCVSCYQCGTKIKGANGSCPICRKKMVKVKRIFTA